MTAARRSRLNPSPEACNEQALLEAAQRDPGKFDALYELHFERVYAFVAGRVHDRAKAEDLTADVFHKALAGLPKYEWRGAPFAAWLFRIAANAIIDQHKREQRGLADREVSPASEPIALAAETDLQLVEYRARLFQLVGRLPEAQRLVIRQRFIEQRSIREIAQRLGKTPGAVKQLQFRALQSLRTQMESGHA
jgi:RNA polymerase sigma-70 factor (ECF subfamily)